MKIPPGLGKRQPMILVARLIRLTFDIVINLPAAHGADITPGRILGDLCAAARTRLGRRFRHPAHIRLGFLVLGCGIRPEVRVKFFLILLLLHAVEKRLRQKGILVLIQFRSAPDNDPNRTRRSGYARPRPAGQSDWTRGNSRYASLRSSLWRGNGSSTTNTHPRAWG